MTSGSTSYDRRSLWQLKSRPEWLARFNSLAPMVNTSGMVPLDEESLLEHARRATAGTEPWQRPARTSVSRDGYRGVLTPLHRAPFHLLYASGLCSTIAHMTPVMGSVIFIRPAA